MTDEGKNVEKASRVIGRLPLEECVKRCSELRDYVRWVHRLRNDEKALLDFENSCERVERAIKKNVEDDIVNEAQAQDLRGIHIREIAKNAVATAALSIDLWGMPFEDTPSVSFDSPADFARTLVERKSFIEARLVEKLQQSLSVFAV